MNHQIINNRILSLTPSSWINVISLIIFFLINSLFILKYGSRVLSIPIVCGSVILYWIFCVVGIRYIFPRMSDFNNILKSILFIFCIIGFIVLQLSIDPYSVKVDRWSAIHNFIANLFSGEYPYAAQTHLGGYGSPFPVWQVFHIPFYMLGDVGLSFVLCLILFLDSIRRYKNINTAFFCFILLSISPAFIYEIAVRSDLISNFLLCGAIIIYFQHYNIKIENHILLVCVMIGLMASTRISTLIPFAIYFFRDFLRVSLLNKIFSILICILVFVVTFLPFFFWNGEMLFFFKHNPFSLQSRQGNLMDFIIFIPLGIYLALNWKSDFSKYLFNTVIMLVLFIIITFCHNMYISETWDSLFTSLYDITYFDMALPFLVLLIGNNFLRPKELFPDKIKD